jgi:hypothetical protein
MSCILPRTQPTLSSQFAGILITSPSHEMPHKSYTDGTTLIGPSEQEVTTIQDMLLRHVQVSGWE